MELTHKFWTLSISLAIAAIATLAMTSCAILPTELGTAGLYTNVQVGNTATANSVGHKVGSAQAMNFLGLFAIGDASINSAANKGGIKKISHVDVQKSNFLGIYSTYTTYVYGE